jgi:mono/diheme cytochrome c family protein
MPPPISKPFVERAADRRWSGQGAARRGAAIALAAAFFLACAGAALFAWSGVYDVSASAPHSNFAAWAIHATMIRSIRAHAASIQSPPRFSQAQAIRGLAQYQRHCEGCHGAPGLARAPWVSGLTPTPPYLIDAAQKWTPAELRLIVGDGVKMTAMPAWKFTLSDAELWDLVAFLERFKAMTPRRYAQMRAKLRAGR